MHLYKNIFIIIFLTVILLSPVNAEIYSWIDDKGQKHFSNIKHPADVRKLVKIEEIEYEPMEEKSVNETETVVTDKTSSDPKSHVDDKIFYADAVSSHRIKNEGISSQKQVSPGCHSSGKTEYEPVIAIPETHYGSSVAGFTAYGRTFYHHRCDDRHGRYPKNDLYFYNYRHRKELGDSFFRYPGQNRRNKFKSRHPNHHYPSHFHTERGTGCPLRFRNQLNRTKFCRYPNHN